MIRKGFYNFLLLVLFTLYLPKYLWGLLVQKKYRQSVLYRLGFKTPIIPSLTSPVIWIHAVSLGEAKVAVTFVKEIKRAYPEASIVVSSVTETGFHEVAKSLAPLIKTHFFLPFDFSWLMRALVRKIHPQLVVFVEGDLWPNFLEEVKQHGAKTLLVNGKISEKSLQRYLKVKPYARFIFSRVDHYCLQNTLYQERFERLQISQQRFSITGNIKLDHTVPHLSSEELLAFKASLGIGPSDPVIVIGSTHHPEEKLLLHVLKPFLEQTPSLKILIAPRHPERFKKVEPILRDYAPYGVLSRGGFTGKEKVILIDTLGKLMTCYQMADLAIVGGSFVDIGGHNLLEPAQYGVPVLFGPYIYKQREFASLILQEGIGFQVTVENLLETIQKIFENPSFKLHVTRQAKTLLTASQGASLRSWHEAEKLLLPTAVSLRKKV